MPTGQVATAATTARQRSFPCRRLSTHLYMHASMSGGGENDAAIQPSSRLRDVGAGVCMAGWGLLASLSQAELLEVNRMA